MGRTYVDNAYNRRLGRVGMPHGSMVVSRGSSDCSFSSSRTYVDNAYNRSLGRVGMPHGSMVVSRGSGGGGGGYYSSGGYSSGSSYLSDLLLLYERRSSPSPPSPTSYRSPSPPSPTSYRSPSPSRQTSDKTYVDNAFNRRADRVGLPVGSAVVSSGNSPSASRPSARGTSSSGRQSSSPSPAKTYVDNEFNRRIGRVGLPVGSAVVSSGNSPSASGSSATGTSNSGRRSSSPIPASDKTYVDNEFNRRVGRVGLPVGSVVISKTNGGATSAGTPTSPKVTTVTQTKQHGASSKGSQDAIAKVKEPKKYVDNAFNRRHDRVGLGHGAKVVPKVQPEEPRRIRHEAPVILPQGPSLTVYKDNRFNRMLGRVGKPLGTAIYDRKTGTVSYKTYADNYLNRKVGRVGMPKGCLPVTRNGAVKKTCPTTRKIRTVVEDALTKEQTPLDLYDDGRSGNGDFLPFDQPWPEAEERAQYFLNRKEEEMEWIIKGTFGPLKTNNSLIANDTGSIIPLNDLQLGRKIGKGSYSEVFCAKWHKTVVAVKKLQAANLSTVREGQFIAEVLDLCDLDHTNVVKYIGVVMEPSNVCVVMEYMQTSLFDVLFIEVDGNELQEQDRQKIINGICSGLAYLHKNGIAHCDIKSENVLLDERKDGYVAKIADFGLSITKPNTETSGDRSRKISTPRYSAPEVLRGERLSALEMMMADVYSLAIVIYEVVFEDEAYYDLSYSQLQKQVGELGRLPNMETEDVAKEVVDALTKALDLCPASRPTARRMKRTFSEIIDLYEEEV